MDAYESTRDFWKSKNIKTAAALAVALAEYAPLFAYHNCLLEDAKVSLQNAREVLENKKPSCEAGALRLLQNQSACFALLLPKAAAGENLTVELLHTVNDVLTKDLKAEADDEDDDPFLSPAELAEALETLVSEVNAYDGPQALKAAAYFETKFEYLQPFAAANGLTARILANYFLLVCEEPPLIFFENKAERYFDALESYDIREEIGPMLKLMREQTVETWKAILSNAR